MFTGIQGGPLFGNDVFLWCDVYSRTLEFKELFNFWWCWTFDAFLLIYPRVVCTDEDKTVMFCYLQPLLTPCQTQLTRKRLPGSSRICSGLWSCWISCGKKKQNRRSGISPHAWLDWRQAVWANPPAGVQTSVFGGGQRSVWAIRCSNVSVSYFTTLMITLGRPAELLKALHWQQRGPYGRSRSPENVPSSILWRRAKCGSPWWQSEVPLVD